MTPSQRKTCLSGPIPLFGLSLSYYHPNTLLSIRLFEHGSQLAGSLCSEWRREKIKRECVHTSSATFENCLAFSSWFQQRKRYASPRKGRAREKEEERVHRRSSPASDRRPPWWIMLPNNGSGLSQSEHALIAGRHTNMPLFPLSPRSPTRIDIVPWQMQVYSMSLYLQMSAPVSGERRIKKIRLSYRSVPDVCRAAWSHTVGEC